MRFDKFTLKLQEAFGEAETMAGNYGHQGIDVEHLLLALLRQPEGIVSEILKKLGVQPGIIEKEIEKTLQGLPSVSGGGSSQRYITSRLKDVMDSAFAEASRLTDEYVSVEHVLLGILNEKAGSAKQILQSQGVTKDTILRILAEIRGNQRITDPNWIVAKYSIIRVGRKGLYLESA